MSIKIERIKKTTIGDETIVSLKKMGNIYEICWCEHKNNKASITKIDKDHYIDNSTGEVKESNHINNRYENKAQLSQSFKRLRELINTNATNIKNCRWVTLTYREHITDTETAYKDFDKFIKRFRYRFGDVGYINVSEPQGNGRWHFHCLMIFPNKAPYIPNNEMEEIWGNGFTKTQQLNNNIDNLGAYLSAHISDIEIDEATKLDINYNESDIKEVKYINGKKTNNPKYFIKGARLSFYPPNFKLYRTSRGIKQPEKEYLTYKEAKEKIGLAEPTYSKSIQLTDIDGQFNSKIIYEHYNTKRKRCSKKTNKINKDIKHTTNNKISSIFLSAKLCIFMRFKTLFNHLTLIYMKIKERLNLPHKKRE